MYDSVKRNFYRKAITATTFSNFSDTKVTSNLTFKSEHYGTTGINPVRKFQDHQYNNRTMQALVQSINKTR
jgi:GTP:adenosylcobinamide-phosphate guanylyltransferase